MLQRDGVDELPALRRLNPTCNPPRTHAAHMPYLARIDVATLALPSAPDPSWLHLATLLSEAERRRAARFHFEPDRQAYIAAHALKRRMLCDVAGGAPGDWEFATEPGGKPVVAGGHGPHFSLSHSHGLVACALSHDVPLGIDIEPIGRRAPLGVAQTFFSIDERAWLFDLPPAERPLGFFRLWTLKEALIKATGKGLAQSLRGFAIGFDPPSVRFADPANAALGPWCFMQTAVARHVMGLVWRGPDAAVTFCERSLQALLPDRLEKGTLAAPVQVGGFCRNSGGLTL